MWRSPLHYLGYTLEWSLIFGARVCWGGGNVTFHGIYIVSPRDSFIVGVSMHLWATLCMTCSGSQGDLVSPVSRGRKTRPLGGASLITQSVQ